MSIFQQINNYDLIEHRLSSMKTWNCEMLFNPNNTNDELNITDLCNILKGDTSFFFPLRFSGVASKTSLFTN